MAIQPPTSAQHRFKTEYWTRSKTPLSNSAPNNIKKFVPEQLIFARLVKTSCTFNKTDVLYVHM
jgi:hypothetical protein